MQLKAFLYVVVGLFLGITPACSKSSKKKNSLDVPTVVHQAILPQEWYSHDEKILNKDLENYLTLAQKHFNVAVEQHSIKAIIAPHAGYHYSGLCAASAYNSLLDHKVINSIDKRKNKHINRVVILAPSHSVFFHGVALPYFTHYKTPLGMLEVDQDAVALLDKNFGFTTRKEVYLKEHSLEMQLPMLQKTIADFKIVPLIVGLLKQHSNYEIANQLATIIDDQTLIVVSSDFLHHGPNYDYNVFPHSKLHQIRFMDSMVIRAITGQSFDLFKDVLDQTRATICGREPITILLTMLERGMLGDVNSRLCSYYTSPQLGRARSNDKNKIEVEQLFETVSDTDAENSVSYVGMIFSTQTELDTPKEDRLTAYEKKALLRLARDTIINTLKPKEERIVEHLLNPLQSSGVEVGSGAFVTLHTNDGKLRGCIGRIQTDDPLYRTVMEMAKAAAFSDSRFSPVTLDELGDIIIDISVLTPPVPVNSYKDIEIGRHGIIFKKNGKNAVFLPQVPVELKWDLKTTLNQLSLKAGFGREEWRLGAQFEVFEGFEFKEK